MSAGVHPDLAEYRRIRDAEGVSAAFDHIADRFYEDTHMMAPGKDDAARTHTHDERNAAFTVWRQERGL